MLLSATEVPAIDSSGFHGYLHVPAGRQPRRLPDVADQTSFPAATTMCGALVKFAPGGLRQMHWHTTLDEWQFVINGISKCSAV